MNITKEQQDANWATASAAVKQGKVVSLGAIIGCGGDVVCRKCTECGADMNETGQTICKRCRTS